VAQHERIRSDAGVSLVIAGLVLGLVKQ